MHPVRPGFENTGRTYPYPAAPDAAPPLGYAAATSLLNYATLLPASRLLARAGTARQEGTANCRKMPQSVSLLSAR